GLHPAVPIRYRRGFVAWSQQQGVNMSRWNFSVACSTVAVLLGCGLTAGAEPDPYESYVKNSKDFRRVKQDKAWLLKAYPSWLYMPWTHQWTIGYTDESGK